MRIIIVFALGMTACAQTVWRTEMDAGNASLDPKTAREAEQHFRSAVSAASTPAEKAAALTKLGLVRETLVMKNPGPAFLMSDVEPLYAQAVNLDSAGTADHALALELYSMLLQRTNRSGETDELRASAVKIRRSLIAAMFPHDLSACPGSGGKKIGGGVSAPKLTFKVEPSFSQEARLMHYQGTVVLYVVVGTNGQIVDGSLVRGLGLGLDEHAIEAIRKWSFEPGMKAAEPVCVSAQIEVNFRLL